MTYPLTADGGPEDLPRTLRREKEAREREAREREAAERAAAAREALPMGGPASTGAYSGEEAAHRPHEHRPHDHRPHEMYAMPDATYPHVEEAAMPARVVRLDVPFLRLVAFFLKAVLAAIPALILLGVILWFGGHLLQTYFPWLIKAQILIHFPG